MFSLECWTDLDFIETFRLRLDFDVRTCKKNWSW